MGGANTIRSEETGKYRQGVHDDQKYTAHNRQSIALEPQPHQVAHSQQLDLTCTFFNRSWHRANITGEFHDCCLRLA